MQIAHLAYGFLVNVVLSFYDHVICVYSVDYTVLVYSIQKDYAYEPIITVHYFCYNAIRL